PRAAGALSRHLAADLGARRRRRPRPGKPGARVESPALGALHDAALGGRGGDRHRRRRGAASRVTAGRRRQSASQLWKKLAIAPADPATTSTAHSSSTTSTTRPSRVSGFAIEEDTVKSCAVTKKSA